MKHISNQSNHHQLESFHLFQSQHDEPYHSSHTIIHDHVVYSHSHTNLTWLKNSQTQNYPQQRRNDPLRTSNTEQNKAKFNLINTTTNTTSITKTFTYYLLTLYFHYHYFHYHYFHYYYFYYHYSHLAFEFSLVLTSRLYSLVTDVFQ